MKKFTIGIPIKITNYSDNCYCQMAPNLDLVQFWALHKSELIPIIRGHYVLDYDIKDDRFKSTNKFKLQLLFKNHKYQIALRHPEAGPELVDFVGYIPLYKFKNNEWKLNLYITEDSSFDGDYFCDCCRGPLWDTTKKLPINVKMCTECDFDLCEHHLNMQHPHQMFNFTGLKFQMGAYIDKPNIIQSVDITLN